MRQKSFPELHPARADEVSGVAKERSLSTAAGMVAGDMTHGQVAEELSMSNATICYRLLRDRDGQSLRDGSDQIRPYRDMDGQGRVATERAPSTRWRKSLSLSLC